MRGEVWLFDVDGCLVDALSGSALRPHTVELLNALNQYGAVVTVWSAGGAEYAERRAREHGFHHLVDGFYPKGDKDVDTQWTVTHIPDHHLPTVMIDDQPEYLPAIARVIAVRPFLGPGSFDRIFSDLLTSLDPASNAHRSA